MVGFQKGNRFGRGRPKGSPNRTTVIGRSMLEFLERGDDRLPPAIDRWRSLLTDRDAAVRLAAELPIRGSTGYPPRRGSRFRRTRPSACGSGGGRKDEIDLFARRRFSFDHRFERLADFRESQGLLAVVPTMKISDLSSPRIPSSRSRKLSGACFKRRPRPNPTRSASSPRPGTNRERSRTT